MSIDFFYPGNRDRARRVQELVVDISGMHRQITNNSESMDKSDKRMKLTLDSLMAKSGRTTYSELEDMILDKLPPDEQKQIKDMLVKVGKVDEEYSLAFKTIGYMTAVAGGSTTAVKAVSVIKAGALVIGARLTFRAIGRLVRGSVTEARALVELAVDASKLLVKGFESGTKFGKILRVTKIAGKVSSVLGVISEGILAIIAAVEGDKQRDNLREKIDELYADRIIVTLLSELAMDTAQLQSTVADVLETMDESGLSEANRELAVSFAVKRVNKKLDNLWETRTYESSASSWVITDNNRNSWTNEDPSIPDAIAKLEPISSLFED